MDALAAQSTHCDTHVDKHTSGTQKRFRCNIALSLADSDEANLSRILATMGGVAIKRNGLWSFEPARYEAPTLTYDESHLDNDAWSFESALPTGERFSSCRAVYRSADHNYREHESATRSDSSYLTRDNSEPDERVLDLQGVTDEIQAQRLCEITLNTANQQGTFTCEFGWEGLRLIPGARFNMTVEKLGWSNQVLRVTKIEGVGPDGGAPFRVESRLDSSSAWDDLSTAGFVNPASPSTFVVIPPAPMIPPADLRAEEFAFFPLGTQDMRNVLDDSPIPGAFAGGSPTLKFGIVDGMSIELNSSADSILFLRNDDADDLEAGDWSATIQWRSKTESGDSRAHVPNRDDDFWSIEVDQSQSYPQDIKLYVMGSLVATVENGSVDGWNMAALTMTSGGAWEFYTNGRLRATGTGYSSPAPWRPILAGVNAHATPTTDNPYHGRLGYAGVFTGILAPEQCEYIYTTPNRWLHEYMQAGVPEVTPIDDVYGQGLLAVFAGNDIAMPNLLNGSSISAATFSGSDYYLRKAGGMAYGRAIELNNGGGNDQLELLDDTDRQTWMADDFAVSLWFQTQNGDATGHSTATLFYTGNLEIRVDQSMNASRTNADYRQSVSLVIGGSVKWSQRIVANVTWYHLTFSYDAGETDWALTINGRHGGFLTVTGSAAVTGTTSPVVLGNIDAPSTSRDMEVEVCLIALYRRVLSSSEALAIYRDPTGTIDLAATGGAPEGTLIANTPALSISNTISAEATIQPAAINDGGDIFGSVPGGVQFISGEDGDALTFNIEYGVPPEVHYIHGGLVYVYSYSEDQHQAIYATDITTDGFTVFAKIAKIITKTARSETTTFSPTGLDLGIKKLATSDQAYNDSYKYEYDITIQNGSAAEGHPPGRTVVGIYYWNGATFVKAFDSVLLGNEGEATTAKTGLAFVLIDGLSGTGDIFAIALESTLYAGSTLDDFVEVSYDTGTLSGLAAAWDETTPVTFWAQV